MYLTNFYFFACVFLSIKKLVNRMCEIYNYDRNRIIHNKEQIYVLFYIGTHNDV